MRFAQPHEPLFHRVQIITERTALTHFPLAPFLRHRRDDTVLVDIQSKIEFFFHWCVCLFDLLNCNASESSGPGRWCGSDPPQKRRVALEKYERQTHPSFQRRARALTSRP